MTTTAIISRPRFDIVEYIKKLRSAGVSQELAEVQAQELGHAMESVLEQAKEAHDHTDLATKGDIVAVKADIAIVRAEMKETESRLQKEMREMETRLMTRLMTMYGAGFLILLGVMAKGFHWL